MVRSVSIGVLVDLEFAPDAGGHVKCWERFAQAASRYTGLTGDRIDLTVYFLDRPTDKNNAEKTVCFGPAVRIKTVPAVSGTRQRGLQQSAGHTDLARFHPALASQLAHHDVLHVTSCFALSETAVAVSRQQGIALTGSLHTHVPAFAEIYAPDVAAARFSRLKVGGAGYGGSKFDGSRIVRRLSWLVRVGWLGRRRMQHRVDQVFAEDLLPVWLEAAGATAQSPLAGRRPVHAADASMRDAST